MLLATLCVPLTFATLRRCQIRTWNAAFGTLTMALSPLYFPLATTFMSDVPAFFFTLVFFYGCIRCIQSRGRSAMLWLAGATAAGLLAGSTRQIAWLTVLCSLPALAWNRRHQRGVAFWAVCLWIVSAVAVLAIARWFTDQPYISVGFPFALAGPVNYAVFKLSKFIKSGLASVTFLLSPVISCIALRFRFETGAQRVRFAVFLVGISLVVGYLTWRKAPGWWGAQLLGDHVSTAGICFLSDVVGLRPMVVRPQLQTAFAFMLLFLLALAIDVVVHATSSSQAKGLSSDDKALLWMAASARTVYMLLVLTRNTSFDRYYLPMLFVAVVAALCWYRENSAAARSGLDWSCCCCLPHSVWQARTISFRSCARGSPRQIASSVRVWCPHVFTQVSSMTPGRKWEPLAT